VGEHKRQAAALEAADWFVRFDDRCMSRHDRARYVGWLKQSPVHVAETLRLMRIHQLLRSIVFLPTDAELRVRVGEQVVAGETVLASFRSDGAN
jgi:ferric-dicitrate binding protein FerR (iron transport regulator)